MSSFFKLILIAILIAGSCVSSDELSNCINAKNKMCQTNSGALSLTINACDELFTISDNSDVENVCEYLSTCSTHPREWKCSISGHIKDCFHCIRREYLVKFKENHDTMKML